MKYLFPFAIILLTTFSCNHQKTETMEQKKEPVLGLGEPISHNFTGKTFRSSYSYTRPGRINNPTGLAATLGSDHVTVKFD